MNFPRAKMNLVFGLVVVTTFVCVLSKPMEQSVDGQGENDVVNMQVNQEESNLNQEQLPLSTDQSNTPTDSPPANGNAVGGAEDSLRFEESNQDQAVANESPEQKPVVEQEDRKPVEEEIDWAHGTGERDWKEKALQLQRQQELQKQQQNAENGGEDEEVPSGPPVGVKNPEELMHGDDGHAHEKTNESQPTEEDAKRKAEERQHAEEAELESVQPKLQLNVHDGEARKAAEFMEHQQFGPTDIEEIIHGGHHVHGADQGAGLGQIMAGDVEKMAHGVSGVHEDHGKDKDNKVHSTLDPEQLMHAGEGGHDHNPHEVKEEEKLPGASSPEDPMHTGESQDDKDADQEDNKEQVGLSVEQIVHGEDHVHDVEENYETKNKVRYQDIIDLGLSKEQLKGIDLSKLLEQEQQEFDDWQKGKSEEAGERHDDPSYWEETNDLRKQYLQKIYAKIKEIEMPDLEHAEWEEGDAHLLGMKNHEDVHEGESRVEHEMEMWGNTAPKDARKPYKLAHGRRGMNEEKVEDSNNDL